MVSKAILILICGLPFGHFLFKPADLWHGQGAFFQVGLLVAFCLSFLEKPRCAQTLNRPLGMFTLWAGLLTSYFWLRALNTAGQYALKIFLPFFNWLCFIWFYKLCLEYLDKEKIGKILKWFKYSIIALLFYCALQYFKLDEFLKGLGGYDELVGTIGNSSHLAGYLAIIQPLFFDRKGIIPLILLWLIIFLTGSASGVIVGGAVILFWLLLKGYYKWLGAGLAIGGAGLWVTFLKFSQFFTSSGRIEVWKMSFETFQNKAITGFGLGSFGLMKYTTLSSHWRHAHNEYYQVAFELGLIGFVLLLWIIWDYFKTFKTIRTDLTDRLATIFLGFCLLGLATFNAHLWMIAGVGAIAYAGFYAVKNEELI